MRAVLLSLYFSSIVSFSFVSHPVSYCLLLLSSAFSMSGYSYLMLGFSWYLVLFCLVYIGGVYILFIYISVHNPNPLPSLGSSFFYLGFFFSFFFLCFSFIGGGYICLVDSSNYLCSMFEGVTYCFFCLLLMVGFVIISVVCSEKDSFFR
nr:NADH dehydrogenase subunit 6 [Orientocreadium sp. HS]